MPTISELLGKEPPTEVVNAGSKEPDLFDQFDALFRAETVDKPPHPIVVNRFLASDETFAESAKVMQMHTWDPAMTWELWRLALPVFVHGAPRMRYPAAKKIEPDPLVARIMETDCVRREVAEEKVAVAIMMDNAAPELAHVEGAMMQLGYYYGTEEEKDGDPTS